MIREYGKDKGEDLFFKAQGHRSTGKSWERRDRAVLSREMDLIVSLTDISQSYVFWLGPLRNYPKRIISTYEPSRPKGKKRLDKEFQIRDMSC